jgi:hypothetical protein
MQADDVLPGSTPDGVTIGTADDLPAFAANGGIREASQTWTSVDPIALTFDFRFQFPDEASALAFLDASESDLGEVATGAVLTPLLDPPLPDTRFYLSPTMAGFGGGYNYLMHHGNLVAKVFVGGAPPDITPTMALGIARAAAARMVAALAAVTPSIEPGSSAGASPSTVPLPSPDPTAVAALLASVPPALAARCTTQPFTDADGPREGELARIGCDATNGATITFAAFSDQESIDGAFAADEFVAQAFGTLSISGTCEGGGFDGRWTKDGADAGGLLCYSLPDAAIIDWSDPANLQVATVREPSGDSSAAWQAWLEAGTGTRASAN